MKQAEREQLDWLQETRSLPLESMGEFFDLRVSEYEAHMAGWERHYRWMADLVPPNAESVLDLGCGTGLELDAIFDRMPNLRVTGIDLSEKMLHVLAKKHPGRSLHLLCGDYRTLSLGEDCFDVVLAFETLHHYPAEQKAELFGKIYRCLKPGGCMLECDYLAVSDAVERRCRRAAEDKRRRERFAPSVAVHFDIPLTPEHELQAIRAGGFERAELLGCLPGDDRTAMIRAVKS